MISTCSSTDLVRCQDNPSAEQGQLVPGDRVQFSRDELSRGMIVAVTDRDNITVIWSVPPKNRFTFPTIMKRVSPTLIAQQLISVQPMTAPAGGVFYFDHMYRSGSQPPGSGEKLLAGGVQW